MARSRPRCSVALAFFLLFMAAQASIAQRVTLNLPETSGAVTIMLQPIPNRGGFRSIQIDSASVNTRFTPKYAVYRIPRKSTERLETGIYNRIAGLKLDPSRYFFSGSYGSNPQTHALLFFVGEAGIGAAPVFVIGFSKDGQPYKVLERDELDVTSFQSAPDGSALIIGKTSLSEVIWSSGEDYDPKKPYATTYDPYSVFIVHPDMPATYSLSASRDYNLKHYVWAGPQVRDDYAVIYNAPGHTKPFGSPASRLDAILGKAKPTP